MIRAEELMRDLPSGALRDLAIAWSTAASPMAIASAMRGPKTAERVLAVCVTPVMREDLLLLCANPFDPVAHDEVVEAAPLQRLAVLHEREDGQLHVNADIALSVLRELPLEFGFAATLLARLPESARIAVGRAVEVGPRPNHVDSVLDIAASIADPDALMRRVARLTNSDREVLRLALEQGELPDDLDALSPNAPPPLVELEPGAAGDAGLVFRYTHLASGVEQRPVVPLELLEVLPRILEQVPPPPDPVAAKARRRATGQRRAPAKKRDTVEMEQSGQSRATSASSSGKIPNDTLHRRPLDPREASASASGIHSLDPIAQSGSMSVFRDPRSSVSAMTASGAMTPYRLGRVKVIRGASAIVDLETAKVADAAMRDTALAGDVLEIASESLVVLRPGVDARAWAELCALRLGL